jgi:dynein heavy chain
MVVGPTSGGKSVIIEALKGTNDIQGHPTSIFVINGKAITLYELYGDLDADTREWTDGLLSLTFKSINIPPSNPD